MATTANGLERPVQIPADGFVLDADLVVPDGALGVVVFAHGSGSSRHSSRNRAVARVLQQSHLATLLMDLLTPAEERVDEHTRQLRFDIDLLAGRLLTATDWASTYPALAHLPVGYFGASTGGGAALVAAAERPDRVRAVVSRGGRPDLAGAALARVRTPTLLIVGGRDEDVITLNERARALMPGPVELTIVPGATHLFEEPGTLEQVAELAAAWFRAHVPLPPG
ncbi:MAG TPA: alpha/beta hydrolase [Vicinamibacterales bacterium]|nr:alpha/beta hydrolase [Vicinamibacterales bacterium]